MWIRHIALISVLVLPTLIISLTLLALIGDGYFPPLNDPANWLKFAHGLLGWTYPLWEQTTLQYPPLFNAFLASLILLFGDSLVAVKFAGVLVAALLPISVYPLTKEVSGSGVAALAAVWLIAFHPIFHEMYGWGGYPNLLGLVFLMLAVYFLLKTHSDERLRYFVGAVIFCSLVVLTHHLTTIVLFALALFLAAFFVFIFLFVRPRGVRSSLMGGRGWIRVLMAIVASLAVLALWRVTAGSFQYVVYNQASLAMKPFDAEAFWWIFKSEAATALLFFTAILGCLALYSSERRLPLYVLLAWAVFPFFFTQTYVLGLALDFKRFPAFSVPPMIILSACSILYFKERFGVTPQAPMLKGNEGCDGGSEAHMRIDWSKLIIAAVLLFTLICNISVGVTMPLNVFTYYHGITDYAYGDRERYDALTWIEENTKLNAVMVADETIGRWIEGYSQRRVVLALPPHQIFMVGELERYEAADLILNSNIELRNEYVRLRDGTPYDGRYTPWIAVSTGSGYSDLVYITDAHSTATFTYAESLWSESPYNATILGVEYLQRNEQTVSVTVMYETITLLINRTMSVETRKPSATISYLIQPKQGASLVKMDVPLWIPYGHSAGGFRNVTRTVKVIVEGIPILIEHGKSLIQAVFSPDPQWGQNRILFTFHPSEGVINATLTLTFPCAKESTWSRSVWGSSSDEAIRNYNVTYIVVSELRVDIERLTSDPRYKEVYCNLKIIVYEVDWTKQFSNYFEHYM